LDFIEMIWDILDFFRSVDFVFWNELFFFWNDLECLGFFGNELFFLNDLDLFRMIFFFLNYFFWNDLFFGELFVMI